MRRRNVHNLFPINVLKPGPPSAKLIPKCLVLNARSLVKPDATSALCTNRRQRVVIDGTETDFLVINRGVPQGTVIGPFLFSLMVSDINLEDAERNLLTKFADDF